MDVIYKQGISGIYHDVSVRENSVSGGWNLVPLSSTLTYLCIVVT